LSNQLGNTMTYNSITSTIAAAAAIVALYLVWKQPKPNIRETDEAYYYYDTTTVVHHHNAAQIIRTIVDTVHIPIPPNVDTAAILRSYFTLTHHSDTIRDSSITAIVSDTIGYNRLLSRSFSYQITRPTVIQKKRPRVLIGINSDLLGRVEPTLSYAPDPRWLIHLGYSPTQNSPKIGFSYVLVYQ
jgi:hypothetical protein